MGLLEQLFTSILKLLSAFLSPVILVPAIIIAVALIKQNADYKKSTYYQITKLPYRSVKYDTGRYGEYLTYVHLKDFEAAGAKFLFYVYVPKETGETSEIDVLMICSKGIFVFESKNYSGWIFGNEAQKNWYQTLPSRRGRSHKEHFYNPIMQNRSHIKHLEAFLDRQLPMWSVIVFSDRCTLKSIQIKSTDISVINRHHVASVVSGICNHMPTDQLSESDIANIYNKLYPYTQVDTATKEQHVANIHNSLSSQPIQQTSPTITPSTQTFPSQTPVTEQPYTQPVTQALGETKTDCESPAAIAPLTQNATNPHSLKCPKCNGDLVLRTATRGANAGNHFYGCSNYPKCKYIQNIVSQPSESK